MVHYRGSVPITQPLWSLAIALLCAQSYPRGVAPAYGRTRPSLGKPASVVGPVGMCLCRARRPVPSQFFIRRGQQAAQPGFNEFGVAG